MDGLHRAIVMVAAAIAGLALATPPSSASLAAASLSLLVAGVAMSGRARDLPLDLVLPATIVAVLHRWLLPASQQLESAAASMAAVAVIIVLSGSRSRTATAWGLALAGTAVLQSTMMTGLAMQWVGVAGCVLAVLLAHVPAPESAGSTLTCALASDWVALVLGVVAIGTMAWIDDGSRLVLVPFVVTVLALAGVAARRRRFRELLAVLALRSEIADFPGTRVEVGNDKKLLRVSAAATEQLDLESGVDLDVPLEEMSVEVLHAAMEHAEVAGEPQTVDFQLLAGELGWREVQAKVTYLGRATDSWIIDLDDQTEQILESRQREIEMGRLRDAVKTDLLTGVLNRVGVVEALDRRLQQEHACVIFMDLDGFKDVNDTYGHDAGDAVLKTVAQRMTRALGQDWNLGRLGGDEFVIEGPEGGLSMEDVAALGGLVRDPIRHGPVSVSVDTSIGVATGWRGADPDEVIRAADRAMYVDKQHRRNNTKWPEVRQIGNIPTVGPRRLSQLFERRSVN